ncbi:MAG: L-seryl-tRNA(Sec) selenium transferase, partial [bacterium]|nr:L-seryl-tRNA(Sec) selenium transferase [bacterium]
GIIAGSQDLIDRLGEHPIARGLRSGGPTLAALAATLELYADGRGSEVPFWSMAAIPAADLEARAKACLDDAGVEGEVVAGESVVGAGSVPGQSIPSPLIRIPGVDADAGWHRLLAEEPAIIARRGDGDLIIDLRAVAPDEDAVVAAALARVCRS